MTTTAPEKARTVRPEAEVIAAIRRYQGAHAQMLDLADASADRKGDPEFAELLKAATAEDKAAAAALMPFLGRGKLPPVFRGVAYLPSPKRDGIEAVAVRIIDEPGSN